jgi:hypothetical protein
MAKLKGHAGSRKVTAFDVHSALRARFVGTVVRWLDPGHAPSCYKESHWNEALREGRALIEESADPPLQWVQCVGCGGDTRALGGVCAPCQWMRTNIGTGSAGSADAATTTVARVTSAESKPARPAPVVCACGQTIWSGEPGSCADCTTEAFVSDGTPVALDARIAAVQPAELEPTGWSAWATSSAEGP